MKQTFAAGNLHAAWQGLKNMVAVNSVHRDCKLIKVASCSSTTPPSDLKFFRFEKDNSTLLDSITSSLRPAGWPPHQPSRGGAGPSNGPKSTQSPEPDNICRQTLKYGAKQLGGVFQQLFQSFLPSSTTATFDVETVHSYCCPKEGHHPDPEGPQTFLLGI